MPCLSENRLLAFVGGTVRRDERTEIEAHLDGCSLCRRAMVGVVSRVSSLGTGEPESSWNAPIQALPELRAGTVIENYEILHRIGMGAMGTVYAALDPRLQRKVAIKILHAPLSGEEPSQQRFLHEAQALARLSHPNVVTVHHAGLFADRAFLVMELLAGTSLRTWLEEPRSPREILQVLLRAGDGLAAAHAAGIIHRDFKPDNVIVGLQRGKVWVTDFGLAKTLDDAEEPGKVAAEPVQADLRVTQTGMLLGTPAYMAPEQLRAAPATERSDQFSFCVTLYEALFGQRPFRNTNLEALEAAMKHGAELPSGPRLTRRVRRSLLQGLRARPDERHASMTALLGALRPRTSRRGTAWAAIAVAAALLAWWIVPQVAWRYRAARAFGDIAARLGAQASLLAGERIPQAFRATRVADTDAIWAMVKLELATKVSALAQVAQGLGGLGALGRGDRSALDARAQCLDQSVAEIEAFVRLLASADGAIVAHAKQALYALPSPTLCTTDEGARSVPALPHARPGAEPVRARLAEAKMRIWTEQVQSGLALARPLLFSAHELESRALEVEVEGLVHRGEDKLAGGETAQVPQIFPPSSKPFGRSYAEWSSRWWQWAWGLAATNHPHRADRTVPCGAGQSGNVWFLGTVFIAGNAAQPPMITRRCTVPAETALLMPVGKSLVSTIPKENCPDLSDDGLRACAKFYQDQVLVEQLQIDGFGVADLPRFRVDSPPFDFVLPEDSVPARLLGYGTPAGVYRGVSDSTFVLIRPLPPGRHTIHMYEQTTDRFVADVAYELTVAPGTLP